MSAPSPATHHVEFEPDHSEERHGEMLMDIAVLLIVLSAVGAMGSLAVLLLMAL